MRVLLAAFWQLPCACALSQTQWHTHTKRINQSYNCLRQCGSLGIITQCSRLSKCWKSSFRHRNMDYMESVVWILCQCDMNVNSQILIHKVYYLTRQSTAMDMVGLKSERVNGREMIAKTSVFFAWKNPAKLNDAQCIDRMSYVKWWTTIYDSGSSKQ